MSTCCCFILLKYLLHLFLVGSRVRFIFELYTQLAQSNLGQNLDNMKQKRTSHNGICLMDGSFLVNSIKLINKRRGKTVSLFLV